MSDTQNVDTVKNKKRKKKSEPWIKPYHALVRNLLEIALYPFVRLLYGARVERFSEQGDRQYLVLMNHQTAFDQFFVGLAFKRPVYYVASEDLFSKGLISDVIRLLVNPIPIKKQTTDARAVINCIKVAREGGTIAMAPEGNRTYDGRSVYINPTIAPLSKKLELPIAIFRIEGGFGVHPRWSDVIRRGKMKCGVSRVIEPSEYKDMTDEELYKLICDELYVDETRINDTYTHKRRAEYLERVLYTCPSCGFAKLESRGSKVRCTRCGLKAEYRENKEFYSDNDNFSFHFLTDWYDFQEELVSRLNENDYKNTPLFTDTADMYEEIPYKKKQLIHRNARLSLYTDRIRVEDRDIPFSDISALTVLGKNKLNLYIDKNIYQFKSNKRFCALKYVNLFWHYKNLTSPASAVKEKENYRNGREFLGL